MTEPTSRLDPELAVALQELERTFGPLRVLKVHPNPPEPRPALASAPTPTEAAHPSLFDSAPDPSDLEVMP